MIRTIAWCATATLLLFSCANEEQRSGAPQQSGISAPAPVTVCYRFDSGQQHNWIELTRAQDSAWGNLHYTFEEKDSRHGPFTGKFHGDTLWALYKGMIEGSVEPQEIAFLLHDEKLYEAQGPQQNDSKGVARYTQRNPLTFNDADAMGKGNCPQ